MQEYIRRDSKQKLYVKTDKKAGSTSIINNKLKLTSSHEKLQSLYGNALQGSIDSQKPSDEFLQKVQNSKDEHLLLDANHLKLNIPNNSDLTDLSSTKSGRVLPKQAQDFNSKSFKLKHDQKQNVQEKLSLKKIKFGNIKDSLVGKQAGPKPEPQNAFKEEANESQQLNMKLTPKIDPNSKEVNIETVCELSKESNNLFANDLSCIKNNPATLKKKDNSEIYDQWLNESKSFSTAQFLLVIQIQIQCQRYQLAR